MKRIAAALAVLLCLAVPASADRVALIRTAGAGSGLNDNSVALDLANWRAALDLMGCDYDVISQYTLTNGNSRSAKPALTTGYVGRGGPNSGADRYGLFIHQNYAINATGTRLSNYKPDSLTLAAGWSAVPQIFAGPLRIYGADVIRTTANACSTGVTTTSLNNVLANNYGLSIRSVGSPYTWDAIGGGPFYYRNDAGALVLNRTDPMVQRARLIIGGNSVAFRTNGTTSAVFPDSMGNPATQWTSPGADTAILWTRERKFTTGVDPAPNIFLIGTYAGNGTVGTDIAEKCMAIAIADSASGGKIVGQRIGWRPKNIAVVLNGAFSVSDGAGSADTYDNVGVMDRDSSFVKAGIDSLKALNVPVMVTVNIDSVEAYPNQKKWWFGWNNARYSPESRTQAAGVDPSTYLLPEYLTKDYTVDPFGLWRSRQLATYNRYMYGTACSDNDTTISCLVKFMRDRLAVYTSNLSRTLMASHFDYLPVNFNRRTQASQDSFAIALMRSGYDGAIQGTTSINAINVTWTINSAGTIFTRDAWSPSTYSARERTISVRVPANAGGPSSGQVASFGRFRWLSTREIDENNGTGVATTHWFANEQWTALTNMGWYYPLVNYNHYVHSFQTTCSVMMLRANDLGYSTGASGNQHRRGYTFLRRMVNKVNAINDLKWQGSPKVMRFVHADDVVPQ